MRSRSYCIVMSGRVESLELHSSVCNLNTEGQLIGEKSRLPMANAKVQRREPASISTSPVIPYHTILTKHCDFPRWAGGHRVGWKVMD